MPVGDFEDRAGVIPIGEVIELDFDLLSDFKVGTIGLINDEAGVVRFVIDAALMEHEKINAHPLSNDATTTIAAGDLLAFARATGHEPFVLKVSGR